MKYGVDGMVTENTNRLLTRISSKKVWGLQLFGEAKRCCFVRFDNRHEIKCYIPISFFFACEKCTKKPVDKGLNAHSEV